MGALAGSVPGAREEMTSARGRLAAGSLSAGTPAPLSGETWRGRGSAGSEGASYGPSQNFVFHLPPELRSVGQARGKLTELASGWGLRGETVDDARVVLTELMTNGVLHARSELDVVISQRGQGLRLEVHDASPAPIVPPLQLVSGTGSDGPSHGHETEADPGVSPAATGRGLAIVHALAVTWGWLPDAGGGKVVWAELGTPTDADDGAGEEALGPPAHAIRPVRLIAVPVRLLKASEDHLDDLFRELQMTKMSGPGVNGPGSRTGTRALGDLSPMADFVKLRLARAREPARRAIWEAVRRGDRLIDLNLLADSGMPKLFVLLDQLLAQAAHAAGEGYLLTEPPGREVVEWRRWLRHEVETQIGGKPPHACPFPVEPTTYGRPGPADGPQYATRPAGLAKLRSLLEAAEAPEEGARQAREGNDRPGMPGDGVSVAALAEAADFVGARRAALMLLAEDNETVRFGASYHFTPAVADYWQATSLSADLPGTEAVRTNLPVFFRTFAELDERYPIFLSTPSETDPAVACVPLADGEGGALGCLVLGFGQARDFNAREAALLAQVANEFSLSVRRRLARRRKDAADKLAGALDGASEALLASSSQEDVLRRLVESVVTLLCDGASVHVVDGPASLRYFISRHRDPERLAASVALLQARQQHRAYPDRADLISECVRTGEASVTQLLSEEAIAALAVDEEDLALLRRVGLGSVGVMPVRTASATVAVLSFANNAGRFIADEELAGVGRLVGVAGKALAQLGF